MFRCLLKAALDVGDASTVCIVPFEFRLRLAAFMEPLVMQVRKAFDFAYQQLSAPAAPGEAILHRVIR